MEHDHYVEKTYNSWKGSSPAETNLAVIFASWLDSSLALVTADDFASLLLPSFTVAGSDAADAVDFDDELNKTSKSNIIFSCPINTFNAAPDLASHSLIVQSAEHDKIFVDDGNHCNFTTESSWVNSLLHVWVIISHTFIEPDDAPDAIHG